MIYNRATRVTAAPAEASCAQSAQCTVCAGVLDVTVLPFPQARYPGEVRIQCRSCGIIETPAMRARAMVPPCIICGEPVPQKRNRGGLTKRYCGVECRQEQARRVQKTVRDEQRGKAARVYKLQQGGAAYRRAMFQARAEAYDAALALRRGAA